MKVENINYFGSSRQLRKFRHKLLKAGIPASKIYGKFEKDMLAISVFTDMEFIFTNHKPEIIIKAPGWNLKYTGRQYKQALQALNIPL